MWTACGHQVNLKQSNKKIINKVKIIKFKEMSNENTKQQYAVMSVQKWTLNLDNI